MALFGNSGSSSAASKNLVEFRCGKMRIKGRTVTADKRKGMLYIHQSDDSLIHLCWKERDKAKAEDDLIIFPDDCEWKKVAQCTTGRVFVLKFNSSLRRIFFWMQEPKEDKDEDLCKKVNDSLNNPPKMGRGGNGAGSAGLSDLTDALGQGNLQDLFNNVDHQQLLQIMAAGGGLGNLLQPVRSSSRSQRSATPASKTSTTPTPASTQNTTTKDTTATPKGNTATTTTTAGAGGNTTSSATTGTGQTGVKLSQLQDILSHIQKPATPIDLSEAITPEAMMPILSDPKVQERLRPHLPAGSEAFSTNADELRATARSPHFRQAMASFSSALASGQLGPLLAQFGLPKAAQDAADKGDVEEFAKAMQDAAKKDDKNPSPSAGAGKPSEEDEEEKMNVD